MLSGPLLPAPHPRIRLDWLPMPPALLADTAGWGGGGGWHVQNFIMAKLGVVRIWYEILNTVGKCGTKLPRFAHPGN